MYQRARSQWWRANCPWSCSASARREASGRLAMRTRHNAEAGQSHPSCWTTRPPDRRAPGSVTVSPWHVEACLTAKCWSGR
eukprot:5568920-Pyramimonas_sp.AAC.1